MFPHSTNNFSVPGQDPLVKELNQILIQTNTQISQQSKIIQAQANQIKELTESLKTSAQEAKNSSDNAKKSAKWSFIVSCIMGGIALATLIIELIRLAYELNAL